ncbi:monosaccharide ABC transporter membrane protein, CUT2 family [Variovorax sp. YR750]|uniref:ABC transporter permease n=1 Tax=Variovorax sp. YR750 TaxID=1884384 RepID=UPI0008D76695|nr:ABC transporter permease [Variovorax sp. YR750]SEM05035.1 monosaccharide ABC transporter membrane protein, CUT2 family [Variovorax sp. YR750]
MHNAQYLRSLLTGQNSRQGLWILPLLMALALSVWIATRQPTFIDSQNLLNLVAQAVPLLVAALGQLVVVLIGGLDLSVGAVISLTTAILASGAPAYVVIPGLFLAAAVIGLVNGLTIARLNVHPIIATLSTASVVQGVTLLIRPVAGGEIPAVVTQMVGGSVLGVPMPVVWTVGAVALGWKLVHASRFGLHLFAVGGGAAVASSYGIRVERITISAYVLSALFAAAAGMVVAGRVASGDPNIGALFAIESITAVALGGVQLAGGIGSVIGAFTGAAFLALLNNGMNLENISAFIQTVIKGLILLAVVAMQPRKTIGL